jgi:DNA gyrase/topoisomerase IV subunit A
MAEENKTQAEPARPTILDEIRKEKQDLEKIRDEIKEERQKFQDLKTSDLLAGRANAGSEQGLTAEQVKQKKAQDMADEIAGAFKR